MVKVLRLLLSLFITLSAAFIGSNFTTPSIAGWYANLKKPAFNPPNWVFGPVWTILFILMGVAFFLVWNRGFRKKSVKASLFWFLVQLVLNVCWSLIFFTLKSPGLAFLELITLWVFILITIQKFVKVSRLAAYLLWPYIIWVSFAGILNFSIWWLNK